MTAGICMNPRENPGRHPGSDEFIARIASPLSVFIRRGYDDDHARLPPCPITLNSALEARGILSLSTRQPTTTDISLRSDSRIEYERQWTADRMVEGGRQRTIVGHRNPPRFIASRSIPARGDRHPPSIRRNNLVTRI